MEEGGGGGKDEEMKVMDQDQVGKGGSLKIRIR